MILRAQNMFTLFVTATGISACIFWQGPLLSAPSNADALAVRHNEVGIQAYKQNQWNRAKEQFEAAVMIAPALAEAHYNLGMALYMQGKDAEAKRHFIKARDLEPENEVIKDAPPFRKKREAPSVINGPSGMPDGHGHSH